jgi:hypothetical protein
MEKDQGTDFFPEIKAGKFTKTAIFSFGCRQKVIKTPTMKTGDQKNPESESRAAAHSDVLQKKNTAASLQAPIQMLNVKYYPHSAKTKIGNAEVCESNGAEAEVEHKDYDTGSATNDNVRKISQEASKAFGTRFIAGHMLNNHLGGPGTNQDNITAITSGQNSAHHNMLEKHGKDRVKNDKKTIKYYTYITKRADFYDSSSSNTPVAKNLASELEGGFTDMSDNSTFGPVLLTLGPPSGALANEKSTGMKLTGRKTTSIGRDVEQAASNAETILADNDYKYLYQLVKDVYGMDEEELKEDFTLFYLKYNDPMKNSNVLISWTKQVKDFKSGTINNKPPHLPNFKK